MKKSICCIALALVMALSTVGLFASCLRQGEGKNAGHGDQRKLPAL